MLFTLQIPFADSRPFLNSGPARLSMPSWPIPIPENEFVRCFGAVHARARGVPVGGVFSEDFYFASSAAAIKFPELGHGTVGPAPARLHPRCAFRRFFCDGGPVSRVEIGLACEGAQTLDGSGVLSAVRDILDLPTMVSQCNGSWQRQPLRRQGAHLAKLYVQATTCTAGMKQGPGTSAVWAGLPTMVIEYDTDLPHNMSEITGAPERSSQVKPDAVGGLAVGHFTLVLEGRSIGVWMIGRSRENRDTARRLRLCLLRLHAEQQVLSQALRWIANGTLEYQPKTPAADRLEEYLNRATHTIFQKTRNGVEQEALRDVMAAYDWVVSDSERQLLMQQLSLARRQLLVKLERFTALQAVNSKALYVELNGDIIGGEVTIMGTGPQNTTNIDFGEGNVFHGDVIAAGYIKDSFNKAASTSKVELQQALTELTSQVASLVEKLDADQQRQTARKLKSLTEEATDEKPDTSALEFNGKGLIEAAKTVAEMVGPVTTAVKGALALFGIML